MKPTFYTTAFLLGHRNQRHLRRRFAPAMQSDTIATALTDLQDAFFLEPNKNNADNRRDV